MIGYKEGVVIHPSEKWDRNARIRGVLFDMDGLILDTEKLYTRFWMEAANALGYPMTREQALGLRSLSGAFGAERMRSYFGEHVDYEKIKRKRIELMDAFIAKEGVETKPGIRKLLAYLKENGIKTAVATSSPPERTVRYLKSVGLEEAFDQLVSGYMVKKGKPEPDIYQLAAGKLGLAPEECFALEDSPSGILSAYRAGCFPIMIPDQDAPGAETEQYLFAEVRSLDLIPDLFEWFKD